ncbi:hypothetical protein CALCODRAFT_289253 [Calocera cornea HHB12733]|uniref:Uncharacterized protein n=1 Tax=Calocera cornea HHB12733 TaxID=1353952 RepID=A0A165FW10_9BASI|nr:hypothetical protein CALCODRAFT_289253 [Calocera cornea HHB12733]
MFRGQDLPMTLHLNHLTPFRPIGFVSDRPWASDMPCAGYFFLARRGGLDILKTWWDIDWPEKNLERDWEQAAYRRLMFEGDPGVEVSLSNPIYRDRSVILENEAQFELQDSRQLIFHSMYMYGDDRLPKLKDVWRSFWDVALDDHDALRELLKGINVQHINATEVAEDMEHFPSLRSSNSYHGMY